MKKFFARWIVLTLSLILTSKLMGSVQIDGFVTAFVAAGIFGVVNTVLKPVIMLFTLPLNILTMGLFTLVINGSMFSLAAFFVSGFYVSGFWGAVIGAVILSVVNMFFTNLFELNEEE